LHARTKQREAAQGAKRQGFDSMEKTLGHSAGMDALPGLPAAQFFSFAAKPVLRVLLF